MPGRRKLLVRRTATMNYLFLEVATLFFSTLISMNILFEIIISNSYATIVTVRSVVALCKHFGSSQY